MNHRLNQYSTECNTGIIAGSLPTLKPLFKRVLGTYGSQSKTTREYFGSKRYKLRSMLRSRGTALQSRGHRSENLSIIEQTDMKNPQSQVTSMATSATYPGSQGSNSSEERILPIQGEGIVCTTEVMVSHSQNLPPPPPSPPTARLGRMRSLRGIRADADDRV
jgi:hypothetical protein